MALTVEFHRLTACLYFFILCFNGSPFFSLNSFSTIKLLLFIFTFVCCSVITLFILVKKCQYEMHVLIKKSTSLYIGHY